MALCQKCVACIEINHNTTWICVDYLNIYSLYKRAESLQRADSRSREPPVSTESRQSPTDLVNCPYVTQVCVYVLSL